MEPIKTTAFIVLTPGTIIDAFANQSSKYQKLRGLEEERSPRHNYLVDFEGLKWPKRDEIPLCVNFALVTNR